MTNKEAIEFIKNMIDREAIGFVVPEGDGDVAIWQYHVEALEMAITALDQLNNNSTKPDNSTSTQFNAIKTHVKGMTACRVPEVAKDTNVPNTDFISRQVAIDALAEQMPKPYTPDGSHPADEGIFAAQEIYADCIQTLEALPSAQPDLGKYEYHYDHTDCIWYRPEARNRCPVTCAQYRDGWNDAMNYIFRDGKGYRPYRKDRQYEE